MKVWADKCAYLSSTERKWLESTALATHIPTLGLFFRTLSYCFWPCYENFHEAVFRRDSSMPDKRELLTVMQELLVRCCRASGSVSG